MSRPAAITLTIVAFLICTFAAIGCAPANPDMELGRDLKPPHGAVEYCQRNPEDENCK